MTSKKQIKINSRGISLVGVVITMGVLAVLLTIVSKIFYQQLKNVKFLEAKSEKIDLTSELRSLLHSRMACVNTLSGLKPSGNNDQRSFSEVKDASGAVVYSVGDIQNKSLRITSMEVLPDEINIEGSVFQIKILIHLDYKSASVPIKPIQLSSIVLYDAANVVTDCITTLNLSPDPIIMTAEGAVQNVSMPGPGNTVWSGWSTCPAGYKVTACLVKETNFFSAYGFGDFWVLNGHSGAIMRWAASCHYTDDNSAVRLGVTCGTNCQALSFDVKANCTKEFL